STESSSTTTTPTRWNSTTSHSSPTSRPRRSCSASASYWSRKQAAKPRRHRSTPSGC
ncbi:uncharacterized protein METZ01_LOCUS311554, partial [marine metagenome]